MVALGFTVRYVRYLFCHIKVFLVTDQLHGIFDAIEISRVGGLSFHD